MRGGLEILAERDEWNGLERLHLKRIGDPLLRGHVGRGEPSVPQGLDLGIIGPAEPGIGAVDRNMGCAAGVAVSAPALNVKNTLQPPFATGSLRARRVSTVPQSIA